jgi:hypothetical protein
MNYVELLALVQKYWADKSRSAEQTASDLEALKDELGMLIDALKH